MHRAISALAALVCVTNAAAQIPPSPTGDTGQLAFLLLSESQLPDASEVVKNYPTFAGPGQGLRFIEGDEGKPGEVGVLEFELNPGGTAFVTLMPMVIPTGEAEEAAIFSISAMGTGWAVPPYAAHLVVHVGGAPTSVEALSRFTSLLGAIAEASSTVAIYWGDAGATHEPQFFVGAARERDPVLRMMLWTGVSVASEASGRLSLLSLGMGQLDLPNLLLTAPADSGNETLARFFDLLAYLAERGEPIPEGETVGFSAHDRHRVSYVPSPIDADTEVWRVELQ